MPEDVRHTNAGRPGAAHPKCVAPPRAAACLTPASGRPTAQERRSQGVVNPVTSREDLVAPAEEVEAALTPVARRGPARRRGRRAGRGLRPAAAARYRGRPRRRR